MSRPKNNITPLGRLLIFLIIILPILYLIASYINGEDGVENIKGIFGQEKTSLELIEDKKEDIRDYEKKIEKLEAEIEVLEKE